MKLRISLIIMCWVALLFPAVTQAATPISPEIARYGASCRITIHYAGGITDKGSGTLIAKAQHSDGKWAGLVLTCGHICDFAPDATWRHLKIFTKFPFDPGINGEARIFAMDRRNDLMLLLVYVKANTPVAEIAQTPPKSEDACFVTGFGGNGVYNCRAGKAAGYTAASAPVMPYATATAPVTTRSIASVPVTRKGTPPSTEETRDMVPNQLLVRVANVNQGDSGGGIYNADSRLVGVLWGGIDTQGAYGSYSLTLCKFMKKHVTTKQWRCDCVPGIIVPVDVNAIGPGNPTDIMEPIPAPQGNPYPETNLQDVLANQETLKAQIAALQKNIIGSQSKETQITLHVESSRYISPSYVDVSVLWALQQQTGVDHVVLITDTKADHWKRMQAEYEAAKKEFPAIVLYDVTSTGLRFKELPQIVIYPVKQDGETKVVKGTDAVSKTLQKFARNEFQ